MLRLHREHALRTRLIWLLLLFAAIVLACLLVSNLYAADQLNRQAASEKGLLLDARIEQIDNELKQLDFQLASMLNDNKYVIQFNMPRAYDETHYELAKISLNQTFSSLLMQYGDVEAFVAFSGGNDDLLISYRGYLNVAASDQLKGSLRDAFARRDHERVLEAKQWMPLQIGAEWYLTRILRYQNVYLGACIPVSRIARVDTIQLREDGRILLVTDQGKALNEEAFVAENQLPMTELDGNDITANARKQYLLVGRRSKHGPFQLVVAIPDELITSSLRPFYLLTLLLIALPLAMILVCTGFLQRLLFKPIRDIMDVIARVDQGDLSARIQIGRKPNELSAMSLRFNSMMNQIEHLRIRVYEEKIAAQREELKHLQLQINPHFLLNALNVLFQLAQTRNYELVQKMTFHLTEYFRYMFYSATTSIRLASEIKHTENYLEIQRLRFVDRFSYRIDYPREAAEQMIPPLIIQTFVENSLKYAWRSSQPLHIDVNVSLREKDEQGAQELVLDIRDNGKGFDAQVLQDILDSKLDSSQHVGIPNAKRRLKLIYGDDARMRVENPAGGGARIHIVLPATSVLREGKVDVSAAHRG